MSEHVDIDIDYRLQTEDENGGDKGRKKCG